METENEPAPNEEGDVAGAAPLAVFHRDDDDDDDDDLDVSYVGDVDEAEDGVILEVESNSTAAAAAAAAAQHQDSNSNGSTSYYSASAMAVTDHYDITLVEQQQPVPPPLGDPQQQLQQLDKTDLHEQQLRDDTDNHGDNACTGEEEDASDNDEDVLSSFDETVLPELSITELVQLDGELTKVVRSTEAAVRQVMHNSGGNTASTPPLALPSSLESSTSPLPRLRIDDTHAHEEEEDDEPEEVDASRGPVKGFKEEPTASGSTLDEPSSSKKPSVCEMVEAAHAADAATKEEEEEPVQIELSLDTSSPGSVNLVKDESTVLSSHAEKEKERVPIPMDSSQAPVNVVKEEPTAPDNTSDDEPGSSKLSVSVMAEANRTASAAATEEEQVESEFNTTISEHEHGQIDVNATTLEQQQEEEVEIDFTNGDHERDTDRDQEESTFKAMSTQAMQSTAAAALVTPKKLEAKQTSGSRGKPQQFVARPNNPPPIAIGPRFPIVPTQKSRKNPKEELDLKECQKKFKALPKPQYLDKKQVGLPPDQRLTTRPVDANSKLKERKPTPFKARPMPNFDGQVSEIVPSSQRPARSSSPVKKATTKQQQPEASFKARPMPDFFISGGRGRLLPKTKPVTVPVPFTFHTGTRKNCGCTACDQKNGVSHEKPAAGKKVLVGLPRVATLQTASSLRKGNGTSAAVEVDAYSSKKPSKTRMLVGLPRVATLRQREDRSSSAPPLRTAAIADKTHPANKKKSAGLMLPRVATTPKKRTTEMAAKKDRVQRPGSKRSGVPRVAVVGKASAKPQGKVPAVPRVAVPKTSPRVATNPKRKPKEPSTRKETKLLDTETAEKARSKKDTPAVDATPLASREEGVSLALQDFAATLDDNLDMFHMNESGPDLDEHDIELDDLLFGDEVEIGFEGEPEEEDELLDNLLGEDIKSPAEIPNDEELVSAPDVPVNDKDSEQKESSPADVQTLTLGAAFDRPTSPIQPTNLDDMFGVPANKPVSHDDAAS